MVMSQSLYNASGANYLAKGTLLTEHYISKLKQVGVTGINVTSLDTKHVLEPPEEILQEKTRAVAVKRVYDMFTQVVRDGRFDTDPLYKASAAIINDIMNRRMNLVQLTDIRNHDVYTFAHSVNVAMLCALIGVLIGLDSHRLSNLTFAALLHDLGKTKVPTSVLNKKGRLTDTEFSIVKTHSMRGYELIEAMDIPDKHEIALVARQHHEHMDGKGYPDGRAGDAISLFGRISTIADVYDALTSARPYKKGYPPSVAYNIMKNFSPGHFDEKLLDMFFRNVAIYPVGTIAELSIGYGIVEECKFGKTDRPVFLVFADKKVRPLTKPVKIDLYSEKRVKITSVLKDMELFHFVQQLGFDPATLLIGQQSASEIEQPAAKAISAGDTRRHMMSM